MPFPNGPNPIPGLRRYYAAGAIFVPGRAQQIVPVAVELDHEACACVGRVADAVIDATAVNETGAAHFIVDHAGSLDKPVAAGQLVNWHRAASALRKQQLQPMS